MSVFGFELKEIRNERQCSIPTMARLLGLANKSYADVEKGISKSRSSNVQKICRHSTWTASEKNRLLTAFSTMRHYDDKAHRTAKRLDGSTKRERPKLFETDFYEIEKEIIAKYGHVKDIKDSDPLLSKLREAAGVLEIEDKPRGRMFTYRLNVPVLKKLSKTKTDKEINAYMEKYNGWFYNRMSVGTTTKKDAKKLAKYFGVSLEEISL